MYITGGRRMEPCWHQSWHWQAELSLSPSLSSGKLNSITHSRDREKQKTQSSEENPLPSARRLHMSPSTSVRLFFFFFFFCYPILSYKSKKKRRRFRNPHRVLSWNSLFFFFTMEMDGIFDIVSIHQFPRHLFMALFMRRIGQERNEFLCLCGRLRMMMILPHVSSLIFPETGPALSPYSPAHNRRRRSRRRRTLHGVLLPRHSFPFHSTSHFYESNMFQ